MRKSGPPEPAETRSRNRLRLSLVLIALRKRFRTEDLVEIRERSLLEVVIAWQNVQRQSKPGSCVRYPAELLAGGVIGIVAGQNRKVNGADEVSVGVIDQPREDIEAFPAVGLRSMQVTKLKPSQHRMSQ